jgi:3-oxoacyl-[acyl-carrier protein] reductase
MRLDGKVALVTGGTRGIGAATAYELAREGARVIVTYSRDVTAANALIERLPCSGHRAALAAADDSAAVGRLIQRITDQEGRLDILVNNAARTIPIAHRDLDALTDELFDQMLRVNLRAPFAMIRRCLPLLMTSGEGLIVNISSNASLRGTGSNIAYAAAKAGLNAMTQSLARALAPGIRVVAIAPGPTITSMASLWSESERAATAAANPLKRFAQPEEIAAIVVGLATNLTYINGTIIVSDGGHTL